MNARLRCFNPGASSYPLYGGRGITMCAAWRDDFTAFLRDMGPCPPDRSLDRINPNGHYQPGNCRWATASAQANNTRATIWVEMGTERLSLRQFATARAVDYKKLHRLMRRHQISAPEAVGLLLGPQ